MTSKLSLDQPVMFEPKGGGLMSGSDQSLVFSASALPRPGYRQMFVPMWKNSRRFLYVGGNAFFSSFRILWLARRSLRLPDEIEIHMVDPRSDAAVEATAAILHRSTEQFRNEIAMALTAFHDSSHHGISILLHDAPIQRRIEWLEDGVFVTRYQGEQRYPETVLYPAGSDMHQRCARDLSELPRQATEALEVAAGEAVLAEILRRLGFEADVSDVVEERNRRFNDLWTEATASFRRVVTYF